MNHPTSTPEDLKQRIQQVIQTEVAPALELDGGKIEILDVDRGVVQVRLNGTCGCCPSSVQAVVMTIEEELRRRIPEVEYLEALP